MTSWDFGQTPCNVISTDLLLFKLFLYFSLHLSAFAPFSPFLTGPEPTPRKAQRPKPAIPPEFDRDCKKGLTFLNSCQTYICLCHKEFCDEQTKIAWAIYVLYEVWTSSKMDCLYFQVGRTLQERGRTIHCPTWSARFCSTVVCWNPQDLSPRLFQCHTGQIGKSSRV